jgi:hypothetical protein
MAKAKLPVDPPAMIFLTRDEALHFTGVAEARTMPLESFLRLFNKGRRLPNQEPDQDESKAT